jgi:apolipoprotein N-acyltransferase
MIAIVCALLSAIGFYFSLGLGEQWWLLWLAPVPILWLAFGDEKPWIVFFAAWVAAALGATNLLRAYAGSLPTFVLVLGIGAPALMFAASVMGAGACSGHLEPCRRSSLSGCSGPCGIFSPRSIAAAARCLRSPILKSLRPC